MTDQIWAGIAIDECLKAGIDHFFIAPGSRCTPLTLAVAARPAAKITQHFDERGLAFAALGYGRATGSPGVFICTSGTAVANALPAVVEAAMDKVPLLLFTADRPDELRGIGANQTIEQRHIFGGYPDLFLNMPVPEDMSSTDDPDGIKFLTKDLDRAIKQNHGLVHVNWMFREPFTLTNTPVETPKAFVVGNSSSIPRVVDEVSVTLEGNTLIVVGNCMPEEALEAKKLASHLNCPILSDVTSGLGAGSLELSSEFKLPRPDSILHLGDRLTSKSWIRWTQDASQTGSKFVHITPTGQVVNPADIKALERHQTPLADLASKVSAPVTSTEFRDAWEEAARERSQAIANTLEATEQFSEPAIAHFIGKYCPRSMGLFLGNSMPIRDMDWFGIQPHDGVRDVAANRGASGIDGLIASAVGYASGLEKPTTLLLGDLSALHDLNSLALVARSPRPLIVVVINNHGGHIFDLLPIRESEHFERYFNTPHEFQFQGVAQTFGLKYERLTEMDDFARSYLAAVSGNQSVVLELATDRSINLTVRNQIKAAIKECSKQA